MENRGVREPSHLSSCILSILRFNQESEGKARTGNCGGLLFFGQHVVSQRTLAITQSPPKNYDSKSRPTGDLRASLCSSTSRCGHGQPSTLYTRLTCVHSIGDTSFGASVISCMRQSSGSRPVINAIVPAAMLGVGSYRRCRPRVLGFRVESELRLCELPT